MKFRPGDKVTVHSHYKMYSHINGREGFVWAIFHNDDKPLSVVIDGEHYSLMEEECEWI